MLWPSSVRRSAALLCVLAAAAGCASAPTPPYRDYEVRALPAGAPVVGDTSLTARLRSAVVEAGWTPVPSLAPGVVTTAVRPISGGLSRRTAALDLVPVDDRSAVGGERAQFVRVVVRAEKRSFLGGRTKVYSLDGALRQTLLAPITEALAARGLVALGAPRDRDEDATDD